MEIARRLVLDGETDRARAFAQEHGAGGVLFHLDLTAELAASDDPAGAVGARFDEPDRELRFVPVLVDFLAATGRLADIPRCWSL